MSGESHDTARLPDEPDWPLLDRYLAGRASQLEQRRVERWLATSPDGRFEVEALRHALKHAELTAEVDRPADEIRARTEAMLRARSHAHSPGPTTRPATIGTWITRASHRLTWIASTFTVVAILSIGWATLRHSTGLRQQGMHIYRTGAHEEATATLRDGSRVTLAPNTVLRLTDGDAQPRVVELDNGEAYFEIAHAAGTAFSVHSGPFTTRVLGTTFMIRHAAHTGRVRVAVAEGRVAVTPDSHRHAGATLDAGSIGELTDSTVNVRTVDDLAPGTEWVNGRLVFHDAPVSRVLETLQRWYGYEFHCNDSTLIQKTITIGVSTRSSAAALAVLEDILAVQLSVVGDTVTLTPRETRTKSRGTRVRSYDVWTPTREVGR